MDNSRLTLREIALFGVLGALTFGAKFAMSWLPNIELVSLFVMVYAVVFGRKCLFPIYTYVVMEFLFYGVHLWSINYLYIWAVLWLFAMLLPQNMPKAVAMPVYMVVCGLHGLAFGALYAPFHALVFGLSF